jgi:glycosyltransferase involved in cell wall biosynthesis
MNATIFSPRNCGPDPTAFRSPIRTTNPMTRSRTVSAVIPTRNRPQLVLRAVRSALAQTFESLEVIVVVDGPEAATEEALRTVGDPRLKVLVLDAPGGAARARNAAVESAGGDWIAFLDDDDEWLPQKTELQIERAFASGFQYPIVSSRLVAKKSGYEVLWPRAIPSEPISEYLLARNGWSYGDGLLSTITLLFPKDLFERVNFRPDLPRHQDWDWVLRALRVQGAGIEFIAEPLAIWNQAERRPSISSQANWRSSFDWAEEMRGTITARAYASFLATQVAPQAASEGDWRSFPFLLRAMLFRGAPSLRDFALFLAMWSAPASVRSAVRKANR